jgi:hypothetical protein
VRRADAVAGLLLLGFGLWFAAAALGRLTYWGPNGPGSAFLPAWLGGAMAVLAVALLARALRAAGPDVAWLPRGPGLVRLVAVVGVTVALVALLRVVGMTLGVALFLLVVLRLIERHRWPTAVGIAAGVATLNYLVFTYWLGVPFPVGVLGF